tara:strand:- start:114 stop:320 length:207 start_codon:yes stop_codon:yes gene_type:complete
MIPFRVFDKNNKQMWQVINYHPDQNGGSYLASREDDSDIDGDIQIIPAQELTMFKFVDFIDDADSLTD